MSVVTGSLGDPLNCEAVHEVGAVGSLISIQMWAEGMWGWGWTAFSPITSYHKLKPLGVPGHTCVYAPLSLPPQATSHRPPEPRLSTLSKKKATTI